jgi:hypothetical protein
LMGEWKAYHKGLARKTKREQSLRKLSQTPYIISGKLTITIFSNKFIKCVVNFHTNFQRYSL